MTALRLLGSGVLLLLAASAGLEAGKWSGRRAEPPVPSREQPDGRALRDAGSTRRAAAEPEPDALTRRQRELEDRLEGLRAELAATRAEAERFEAGLPKAREEGQRLASRLAVEREARRLERAFAGPYLSIVSTKTAYRGGQEVTAFVVANSGDRTGYNTVVLRSRVTGVQVPMLAITSPPIPVAVGPGQQETYYHVWGQSTAVPRHRGDALPRGDEVTYTFDAILLRDPRSE